MEIICLDTNVLIAHKRAKKADKDKTFLYQLTIKRTNLLYPVLRSMNYYAVIIRTRMLIGKPCLAT